MEIGFVLKSQTVMENTTNLVTVEIRSSRSSESSFILPILALRRSAIVLPNSTSNSSKGDAIFGERKNSVLESRLKLSSGLTNIETTVQIIDDISSESLECFILRITPLDEDNLRDTFTCNSDDDTLSCTHEICIDDDDGKYVKR